MFRVALLLMAAAGCTSNPDAMSAEKISVVSPAPAASCSDEASCRAECDRGVANACTEIGDRIRARDPDAARDLYRTACAANDPVGCARMAEESGGDLRAADRFALRACGAGDVSSCGFVSQASLLAFIAPRKGEDRENLRELSEQTSKRACELGSYSSCLNAVSLLRHRKGDQAEITELAERGLELAEADCARSRLGACGLVAEWAAAAKDTDRARRFYRAQCRLERRVSETSAMEIEACKKAAAGGDMNVVLVATEPKPREPSGERAVPHRALEATRTAGVTQIQPPDSERAAVRGQPHTAVFKLCLSARGGVRSVSVLAASAHARWNRRLFEAIRGWRYSPFFLDGKPTAVCTSVTFVFEPA